MKVGYEHFDGCQLKEFDFSEAKFGNISFRGANLEGTNFSLFSASYVDVVNAKLKNINFKNAKIQEIFHYRDELSPSRNLMQSRLPAYDIEKVLVKRTLKLEKALKKFNKVAVSGAQYSSAMYHSGMACLPTSDLSDQEKLTHYKKASRYFERAAEQGDSESHA